jgi:hypothetical protein
MVHFFKNATNTIVASKTQFFPESGSGKHFQDEGMHAIDSPHKITPIYHLRINFPVPKNALCATLYNVLPNF